MVKNNFLEGIKFSLGILFIFGLVGIVYAVGFHTPNEILSGTFSNDFAFNGSVNFTGATITGLNSIPSKAIMYFNLSSCPTGWTEATSIWGRYIVGLPSGGTLEGVDGTALSNLEDRAVGQHTHTANAVAAHTHTTGSSGSHTHNVYGHNAGGGILSINNNYGSSTATATGSEATSSSGSHTHTVNAGGGHTPTINNAGSVAGTNAPYIQYLVCQKD